MKKKELKQLVDKLRGDIVTLVTKPNSLEAFNIKELTLFQLDFEKLVMSGDKTDIPPIKSGEESEKNMTVNFKSIIPPFRRFTEISPKTSNEGFNFAQIDVNGLPQPESEEDKLKRVYFKFYDQMNEPERSNAKKDWNNRRAMFLGHPESIEEAIIFGIDWRESQYGKRYWSVIYDLYNR